MDNKMITKASKVGFMEKLGDTELTTILKKTVEIN